MIFEDCLNRYANLLVCHGLNVQAGQMVNLSGEVCHRDLLYSVAKAAYERGAGFVNIDLTEPRLQRLRVLNSSEEQMKYIPRYLSHKYRELVDSTAANLKIVGMEYPELLSDLDPRKLNTGRVANYNAIKYFYEEGIEKSKVHWTVAAGATAKWAKRLFNEDPQDEALRKLWHEIFKICRVETDDYLGRWREHNALLQARAAKLTELKVVSLHFQGPGTDLTVGLSNRAKWKGGSDRSPRGVEFEPNIPTEECFSTPDWRKTAGQVSATRPFYITGKLIEGLKLTFEAGDIVEFDASSGKETFKEYINSDPGGKRLGEVALVGIDSPVFKSGLVFEEILFDENAACHIAVGSAYKFCLEGGETMSKAELEQIGCNESSVHTDIMISSEQVNVEAKTIRGETLPLIRSGSWTTL